LPSGTPLILTNSGNIAKLLNGEPSRQTIYLSISTGDRETQRERETEENEKVGRREETRERRR